MKKERKRKRKKHNIEREREKKHCLTWPVLMPKVSVSVIVLVSFVRHPYVHVFSGNGCNHQTIAAAVVTTCQPPY